MYKTYEDFPSEDLYRYAGLDTTVTLDLCSALYPHIKDIRPYSFAEKSGKVRKNGSVMSIAESYERFTNDALDFIIDLEINGIGYSVEKNIEIGRRMTQEVEGLDERIYSAIGHEIDQDSGAKVAAFLYGELSLEPPFLTKTGEPSVDGDALKSLAEKYDLEYLSLMGKRKDIISVYRTFIQNYVRDFVKRDGRVHPSYNLHGTSSFRISGEGPNLTQLPRPKHGYDARECFVVPGKHVFMCLDFSSAEVKVLANISKDPVMIKAVLDGLDFHSFSASKLYGIPYDELVEVLSWDEDKISPEQRALQKSYKEKRQYSKALTFGIIYGSSSNGIALNLGIPKEQAEKLIKMYFQLYPKIEEYVMNRHLEAEWNQFSVSSFGQSKPQFGVKNVFRKTPVFNAAKRNSQNRGIQSPTSSLGLAAFAECNRRIKPLGARSCCTVYDSIELECPIEKASKVLEAAFSSMNDYPVEVFDWQEVPIGVDAEISVTGWGNLKHVSRGATQEDIERILRIGSSVL